MKFTEFQLNADLLSGIGKAGYESCMPVQEQVLSKALDGADLYVQSQTGTGKTAAYLITIIQRLISDETLKGKKALIMVPTRELAVQVEEEARALCVDLSLTAASFYGGVGYKHQQDLLRDGTDILVGTPGRVIDLQESGTMNLDDVAFLVIDEADRMFDMGFYPDLRVLIKVLPAADKRQTMLFSATLNTRVKNLAWEYTVDAEEINIEPENMTVTEIDQELYHVAAENKVCLLLGILEREHPESIIVFCNTKRMCEVLAKRLKMNGIETEFIIGDLPQVKRLQVIESFKRRSLKCLVATDVAARGLDVDDLEMVINYDLPNEAENYVHRIGRTARAGKTGKAYTLCCEQDVYNLTAIEKYIEAKIPASVAWDDMYAEDKSAGVYIKTEFAHDDYDHGYRDHDHKSHDSRRGRPSSGDRNARKDRGASFGKGDHTNRKSFDNSFRHGAVDNAVGEQSSRGDSFNRSDRKPRKNSSYTGRPYSDTQRLPDDKQKRSRRPDSGISKNKRSDVTEQSFVRDEADRLAGLSFEERMAVYKDKYGTGGDSQKQSSSVEKRSDRFHSSGKSGTKKNSRSRNAGRTDTRKPTTSRNSQKPVMQKSAAVATHEPPKTKGLSGFFKRLFGKK